MVFDGIGKTNAEETGATPTQVKNSDVAEEQHGAEEAFAETATRFRWIALDFDGTDDLTPSAGDPAMSPLGGSECSFALSTSTWAGNLEKDSVISDLLARCKSLENEGLTLREELCGLEAAEEAGTEAATFIFQQLRDELTSVHRDYSASSEHLQEELCAMRNEAVQSRERQAEEITMLRAELAEAKASAVSNNVRGPSCAVSARCMPEAVDVQLKRPTTTQPSQSTMPHRTFATIVWPEQCGQSPKKDQCGSFPVQLEESHRDLKIPFLGAESGNNDGDQLASLELPQLNGARTIGAGASHLVVGKTLFASDCRASGLRLDVDAATPGASLWDVAGQRAPEHAKQAHTSRLLPKDATGGEWSSSSAILKDVPASSCRKGHPLRKHTLHELGWTCDECETKPEIGDMMVGCRLCDYDKCMSCAMKCPDVRESCTTAFKAPTGASARHIGRKSSQDSSGSHVRSVSVPDSCRSAPPLRLSDPLLLSPRSRPSPLSAMCPKGHVLHSTAPCHGVVWICDSCESRSDVIPNLVRYRCAICNFDLCGCCHEDNAAALDEVRCPKDHVLQSRSECSPLLALSDDFAANNSMRTAMWICDGCEIRGDLLPDSIGYQCTLCDYDLCKACYTALGIRLQRLRADVCAQQSPACTTTPSFQAPKSSPSSASSCDLVASPLSPVGLSHHFLNGAERSAARPCPSSQPKRSASVPKTVFRFE